MASNLRVDSIVPATGSSVSIGTATGGVNIPGVLTYEDVTNVDSVGVITARSGIRIGATGANTLITGNGTGIGIGITTPTEELHIRAATPVIRLEDGDNARQSQIVGSDGNLRLDADNNNAIADTNIAFRTDGGERLRIGPVGQIGIGGANYGTSGQVLTSAGSGSAVQWATPSAGITMADSWSITSNFSQSAGNTEVTANWRRNYAGSTNWGVLGSAMTESSGVFSFPITGIYLIQFNFHGRSNGSTQSYIGARLFVSQNAGVGYGQVAFNYSQAYASQAHFNVSNSAILDVANISNTKFRFNTEVQSDAIWFGESNAPKIGSGFYVIRLGDT